VFPNLYIDLILVLKPVYRVLCCSIWRSGQNQIIGV